MEKMILTNDDINNMVEALNAWERDDVMGEMMGDLMGAVLSDNKSPEAKATFERERAEKSRIMKEKRRIKEETSILLKAKLIKLKNKIAVCDLIEGGVHV